MPDKKIELLPFSPSSTAAIEDWINDKAGQGWQVSGTVPFIPILIKFIRGEGVPYHIEIGDYDSKDSVCFLPGCGWVALGETDERNLSAFDENTSLRKRSFRGIILALLEIILFMVFVAYADSIEAFSWLSIQGVTGIIYMCSVLYSILYSLYAFGLVLTHPRDRRRSIWPAVVYYVTFYVSIITLIILMPVILSEDFLTTVRNIWLNR